MAFDAIFMSAVVRELREGFLGGRIDKIYQPGNLDVILSLHGSRGNGKLLLSANPSHPRLHLTTLERENPEKPPMFCMLLRKHLSGARILEIEQPYMERVVALRLECTDELGDKVRRALVLEAMGRRANLILLDGEDRITECLRRMDGDLAAGVRPVLPGLFYTLPEPRFGVPPLLERELRFRGEEGDLKPAIQQMWDGVRNIPPHRLCCFGRESRWILLSFPSSSTVPGPSAGNIPPLERCWTIFMRPGSFRSEPSRREKTCFEV